MPVRMIHEEHGTTFAVGSEVQWNESHGWKVQEKAVERPVEKAVEKVVEVPRRGRPPLRK